MDDVRNYFNSVTRVNEEQVMNSEGGEYLYSEANTYTMHLLAFLPLLSGLVDMEILNKFGIYSITWVQIMLIAGAVIGIYDFFKLRRMNYAIDDMAFFAICATPIYMYIRGKIVGHASWTVYIWFACLVISMIFAPI